MPIFTYEEMNPSKKTIELIKKFAYTYRVDNQQAYCMI